MLIVILYSDSQMLYYMQLSIAMSAHAYIMGVFQIKWVQ